MASYSAYSAQYRSAGYRAFAGRGCSGAGVAFDRRPGGAAA